MAIASESVIGASLPRVEGHGKVTGRARYAADVQLPNALWIRVLHSTRAHARIARLETAEAMALPGVVQVLTGADFKMLTGAGIRDLPILCRDRVRFVGDAVAAVAAEDPDVAEQALALLRVEYEDLPAVFDPEKALDPQAPVLHPDRASYQGGPEPNPRLPNLQSTVGFSKGDVESGFAEADQIFDHTFTVARSHQAYIEPRACAVNVEPDGTVRIWSSCKVPYKLRSMMAELFELERDKVVVEPVSIGGDFGAKGPVGQEPLAYLVARATGRPAKVVRSYVEELQAGQPRHGASIRVRTGVKRDGTLVAREMFLTMDGGAYAGLKYNGQLILPSVTRGLGPYNVPNARLEARWVYTNNVPCGIARAPGQPQVVFAGESQMDLIARALGLDPIDFRLRNMVQDGDTWPNDAKVQGVSARPTLQLARRASGWNEPLKPWRGRGVATSERGIGSGTSGLIVSLHSDGRVTAMSGVPDIGCGVFTILGQILSERLNVPLESVTVSSGNTAQALPDAGTGGSKSTYSVTVAAQAVSSAINRELVALAAQRLECAPEDLEPAGQGYQVKGSPASNVSTTDVIAELAARSGGVFEAQAPGPGREDRAKQWCSVACVAEVEVDPETGKVTPIKITMAVDAGQAINPRLFQGQVEGGMMQGLGMALMEALPTEEGQVTALHLGDYKIPAIADLPELVSVTLEDAPAPGPYGAKAVGELGCIPVAAAVANAVEHATGVRILSQPITAELVRAGMAAAGRA